MVSNAYIGNKVFETEAMPEGSFEKILKRAAEQQIVLGLKKKRNEEKLRKKEEKHKSRMGRSKRLSIIHTVSSFSWWSKASKKKPKLSKANTLPADFRLKVQKTKSFKKRVSKFFSFA